MTHVEAMKSRWFQCWHYPCSHRKAAHFQVDRLEWEKRWAKDIRKEAKAYLKAYKKLTPTQRKIFNIGNVLVIQAQEILEKGV
jgi:hypothetical protein